MNLLEIILWLDCECGISEYQFALRVLPLVRLSLFYFSFFTRELSLLFG